MQALATVLAEVSNVLVHTVLYHIYCSYCRAHMAGHVKKTLWPFVLHLDLLLYSKEYKMIIQFCTNSNNLNVVMPQ